MERFPKIKHRKLGAVSMINNGHDMHGSQFLITLNANLDYLDGKHTVFGEVVKGFEVIEKLNEWICDKDDIPYQDIRILHTVILDDPFEDFAALGALNSCPSPEPTDERLKSDRIRCDEDVDQLEGMTQEQIDEYMKEREAQTRAKLLEIIGDIPDADIKPPENVLFVCKLNPVTTDDDLELIFSRFGKINSCEVIRDRKTGDSLCYAFIEFDREEDCENAYFKMDNVLIDDRRIHVDFSQSVSKVKWKGKGTGTGYFEDNRTFKENKPLRDEDDKKAKYKLATKSHLGKGYDLIIDNQSDEDDKKYEPIRKKPYREDYNSSSRHQRDRYADERSKDHKRNRYEHESSSSGRHNSDHRHHDRHKDTRDSKYDDKKSKHSSSREDNDKYYDYDSRRKKSSSSRY